MPQAFQNPIGGFTQGFLGGAQLGLQIKEQQTKVQARLDEIQKEKFDKGVKLLELGASYSKVKDPAYRKQGLQFMKEGSTLLGKPIPEGVEWSDPMEEVRAGIEESIKAFRKFGDENVLRESLEGWYRKGGEVLETADITRTEKRVEREVGVKKQALLGQVQRLPAFQEAGVITPEQAEEARITGLGEAGALKAPAEFSGREKARTISIREKDGTVRVKQYNEKTGSYDIDVGEAPRSHTDELRIINMQTAILNKYNADPSIKAAQKMMDSASIILDIASSGNPIGHASLATFLTKASGEVGNLSKHDKEPFGGSRALGARIKQALSVAKSGKTTPENIEFVIGLAKIFHENSIERKTKLARERSAQYAGASRGLFTKEGVMEFLAPLSELDKPKSKFKIISVE